jgi:hypothetical protein
MIPLRERTLPREVTGLDILILKEHIWLPASILNLAAAIVNSNNSESVIAILEANVFGDVYHHLISLTAIVGLDENFSVISISENETVFVVSRGHSFVPF